MHYVSAIAAELILMLCFNGNTVVYIQVMPKV